MYTKALYILELGRQMESGRDEGSKCGLQVQCTRVHG